jgi:apolipoprotein N-acyltransferase
VNAAAVGQDLVHAAITGRSTFITADGTVGERTGLFEETVLFGTVQYRTAGPTFYSRFGDLLLYVAFVGLVIAVVWPGESRNVDSLRPRSRSGSA